ncbi:MAG: response regulator [Ignavibacteria bacterium]|nr:response regulator [Ignavibacteria bacterium]
MDKNFFQRLLNTFRAEAVEHLENISDGLISYENLQPGEERQAVLETIYREVHSLKGAARAVELRDIEFTCQNLESVFSALKKHEMQPYPELFDLFHRTVDTITAFLSHDEPEQIAIAGELSQLSGQLAEALFAPRPEPVNNEIPAEFRDFVTQYSPAAEQNQPREAMRPEPKDEQKSEEEIAQPVQRRKKQGKIQAIESFRISSTRLDKLYLLAEEMLASRINFNHLSEELQSTVYLLQSWKREWRKNSSYFNSLRGKSEKLSRETEGALPKADVERLLDFLEWNYTFFENSEKQLRALQKFTFQNTKQLGMQLAQMTEDLKEIMILPFSELLDILPRMIHDLAKDLGKDVEFISEGVEIEVDKRILEQIKDPIFHILRNAIDHGIERPDIRAQKNKSPRGIIRLKIAQVENNRVEIDISDDGKGIDVNQLIESALQKGLLSQDERKHLSETEQLQLIFRSGVSTSPAITDISGRGLGMAIVKENIERLDGSVRVETTPGLGSRFIFSLPLTIAAMRGIKVRCDEQYFILPTTKTDRVLRIKNTDIKTVENRKSALIGKVPVLVTYLQDILEISRKEFPESEYYTGIVLSADNFRTIFIVDDIVDETDFIVKPFNKQIIRIKHIAGATILGDGKVIPILNTRDLVFSAIKHEAVTGNSQTAKAAHVKKNILVVDDSITSRMLVKDILESIGYFVKTAIDGMDALTQLRTGNFDLVVSDVEMPRMNGFQLTASIRKENKLREMPVVLVTGLSKREDREKGIEAGANAYIVKSSFDQSVLIDTIQRLIV